VAQSLAKYKRMISQEIQSPKNVEASSSAPSLPSSSLTLASSSSHDNKNTRVLKLHLRLDSNATGANGGGTGATSGHYKSFLITPNDTFSSLKLRAIDKIPIKRVDSPFYVISIHFEAPTVFGYPPRGPLYPSDEENIIEVLEREELYHEGELLIVLSDLRINLFPKSFTNRPEPIPLAPLPIPIDLCTEFNQSFSEVVYESIPTILVSEIESVSLKIGRLQMFQQSGKDPWRYNHHHPSSSFSLLFDPFQGRHRDDHR
jgi:hypothetical protein